MESLLINIKIHYEKKSIFDEIITLRNLVGGGLRVHFMELSARVYITIIVCPMQCIAYGQNIKSLDVSTLRYPVSGLWRL